MDSKVEALWIQTNNVLFDIHEQLKRITDSLEYLCDHTEEPEYELGSQTERQRKSSGTE